MFSRGHQNSNTEVEDGTESSDESESITIAAGEALGAGDALHWFGWIRSLPGRVLTQEMDSLKHSIAPAWKN